MIVSEKIIVSRDDVLVNILKECTPIYNAAISFLRNELFMARDEERKPSYNRNLMTEYVVSQECWKNSTVEGNIKQGILRTAWSTWQTYLKTLRAYYKNKSNFRGMPKPPDVFVDGRNPKVVIDHSRLRKIRESDNSFCIPKTNYRIKLPDYVNLNSIKCVVMTRYYHKIKLSISYEETPVEMPRLDKDVAIGIDFGVNNLMAMTTNGHNGIMLSRLVRGGHLKSINQYYNKMLAEKETILNVVNCKQRDSVSITRMSMKRALKIEYEFHQASNYLIDLCLQYGIGTIVLGHNDGWKQKVNMGKKNNQNFSYIPFNVLINMIKYKAFRYGIDVIVVNESYTSKCDHLSNESMCHHDNYMGKRITRGLFKSSTGKLLNADINGAIGILRKANVVSDDDLLVLRNRGDVVSPSVLNYSEKCRANC